MKFILSTLAIVATFSSFAATDAQIAGVVFSNQEFVSVIGETKIETIQIYERPRHQYIIVVNRDAPISDGCSYSASITEISERYAINPVTTGIRNVLKVSHARANCARR